MILEKQMEKIASEEKGPEQILLSPPHKEQALTQHSSYFSLLEHERRKFLLFK